MRPGRAGLWIGMGLLALGSLAIVLIPALLIRPFIPQTAESISTAYSLRRWSPAGTLGALLLALVLGVLSWRSAPRLRSKVGVLLLILPVGLSAWLARQNHFEWMFAPLSDPRFIRAGGGEADFVAPGDMVLAVQIGGDAVAYPVPQLAYHHLVEDVVGGVPIVATY